MESFNGNIYIYLPCYLANPDRLNSLKRFAQSVTQTPESGSFLNEMEQRVDAEVVSSMQAALHRLYLGNVDVLCSDTEETKQKDYQFAQAQLYLSVHERTGLVVTTLVMRNVSVSATQLLDQVSKEQILIREGKDLSNIEDILSSTWSVKKSGTNRVCLSTTEQNRPAADAMQYYFACETFDSQNMGAKLKSDILDRQSKHNFAQYDSSELYMGRTSLLRIDCRKTCQLNGPSEFSDSAFLFIVELMVFKDAAISRTHLKVLRKIADGKKLSLRTIDTFTSEFGTTMPFWNVNVFRYTTAKNLAEHIDKVFGTQQDFQDYMDNQRFLEHRVNLKYALATEFENIILNTIAILVFMFEAVPPLFAFMQGLQDQSISIKDSLLASVSSVSLLSLALILFVIILKRKVRERSLDA